jgi:hypothetical protein
MSLRLASHTPPAVISAHAVGDDTGSARHGTAGYRREWLARREALRYYSRFGFAGYDKDIPNSANGASTGLQLGIRAPEASTG